MFLVQDSSSVREARIQQLSVEDPSLSALLAVIHVEWTLRRAIISLGTSPNVEVRKKLEGCHGLKKYKQLWKDEVFPNTQQGLPEVVKNWEDLQRSFRLRHRLVHGVGSCDREFAADRVLWALMAATNIREFCHDCQVDLDARLQVRRKARSPIDLAGNSIR